MGMEPDQPALMDQHQHVLMDLPPSSTMTSPPLLVLTTASPTTALTTARPRPAPMAATLQEAAPGVGVPRSRESAVTDQPRPLMETSPQPPAMMGASPSAPRKSVRWNGYVLRTIDTIVSSDIYCYHLLFLLIFINDQFFKFQNLFYGPMKNNF